VHVAQKIKELSEGKPQKENDGHLYSQLTINCC
jgi:hypothetical protein